MRLRRKTTMIIRLVDIVLIILFGFLLITEFHKQTEIELPKSLGKNSDVQHQDYFNVYIFEDGRIVPNYETLALKMVLPSDANDPHHKTLYNKLKKNIRRGNEHKRPVAIYSKRRAPVQFTVDVIDACKELGLDKYIRCWDEKTRKRE